jgi:hypothetical protein
MPGTAKVKVALKRAASRDVAAARRQIIYVSILKTKAGERWALSHLKAATKARARPLMEFHGHKSKLLGDHAESVCEGLQAAWGVDRWFYVDTIWLHGNSGSPDTIEAVFEATEECDLKAIPVVRTSYDDASLEQLQVVVTESDRGYLLRVKPNALDTPALIDNVVEAIGIPLSKVDLLLDYRGHAMSLAKDLSRIPHLSKWRLLVASSGAFPASLANIPLQKWQSIARNDWISWQGAVERGVPRTPIYSDYTVRAPGPPSVFGAPSVNLRYALEDSWLVQMGGRVSDGAAPEMHAMCVELVNHPQYCGPDSSAGDEEISRVTDEAEGPGGPTQWVQWCVSHHIEFAVGQLSQIVA